jgi:choline dehydrogenase-like flavoprotein
MATFDLNDDGVVCIIGSGAGGGTLGNELAQKGIKVVILEAGGRAEIPDFINDEWASFTQLAWKDMRTTSGTWRVAHDFPNLPAWIVKSVGWVDGALGRRLAALPGLRVQGAQHLRQHRRR